MTQNIILVEKQKWDDLISKPEITDLISKLDQAKVAYLKAPKTKSNLELLLANVEVLMKLINKHNKEEIKPIKDLLNEYRSIVLDFEKKTTTSIKSLKAQIKADLDNLDKEVIETQETQEHICKCGICGKELK